VNKDPQHDAFAGWQRLTTHVEECESCGGNSPPLDRIAALLSASVVELDVVAMSQRTVMRLRPELERRARITLWRRVAAGVLFAVLPLPAVLLYNAYVLRVAYNAVSELLPAAVAAYLLLTYAAFLMLLFASTYAAIPICLARSAPRRAAARG
jgi:Mn2+/Fe2+ NRAMP family transporter